MCWSASSIAATWLRDNDAGTATRESNAMARILIAEDEESLRGLLRRGLVALGHEVVVAADGAEAFEALSTQPAFDLLLSDIRMPVMDGIALALAMARDQPDLAILLMTGYSEHREQAQGLDAIIRGVVAKPFTLEEICVQVNAALAPARDQKSLSSRSI
jgi:CheY-like chemotaxis protein